MPTKPKYKDEIVARQDLLRDWRTFRKGMLTLPTLESQLTTEVKNFSRITLPIAEAESYYWYLGNSIISIIELIDTTTKAIDRIILNFEQASIPDSEIENKLKSYLSNEPNVQVLVKHIRHLGGYRAFLKRLSTFLHSRRKKFIKCATILNEINREANKNLLIGELALQIGDCVLSDSDSETPDVAYSFICLASILGAAFCLAVIAGTLILTEGEAGGDDEDDEDNEDDDEDNPTGDFPVPDPDSPTPA